VAVDYCAIFAQGWYIFSWQDIRVMISEGLDALWRHFWWPQMVYKVC
jgi:hypothetical protein